MNEASAWRVELAREVAAVYAEHPQVRMVSLGGSAARNLADAYSDMDMAVYWAAIDHKWLEGTALQPSGGRRFTYRPLFDNLVVVEQYFVGEAKIDVAHFAMAWWEQSVDDVLERASMDDEKQEVLDGFLSAIALYGEDEYERWRARVAAYPAALGRAMIERNLHFYPQWVLEQQGLARNDLLGFYATLCEMMRNLLGVLAGLNGMYLSMEKPKRSADLLRRMAIAPADAVARFGALLAGDRAAAPADLAALIDETLALVEQHAPGVSTARAREVQRLQVHPVEQKPAFPM
jgi:hypothetical protein